MADTGQIALTVVMGVLLLAVAAFLSRIEDWQADYEELQPLIQPKPAAYLKNTKTYLKLWQNYWKKIQTDPTFESGDMPEYPGKFKPESTATRIYNQSICAFSPGNFKAILFLPSQNLIDNSSTEDFGEKFSAMANSWKDAFARNQEVIDPHFVYAMPPKDAAALSEPKHIRGKSSAFRMDGWPEITVTRTAGKLSSTINESLIKTVEQAVNQVYP